MLIVAAVAVVLFDVRVELLNFSARLKLKIVCPRYDLLCVSKLINLVLFLGYDALFVLITSFGLVI